MSSNNNSQPTILLSRVQEHADSECIAHELRNLGSISHVVVIKCLDMDGSLYNKATVYFKHWYENASTAKPRTALQSGKTINITTNSSYFWQAQAFVEDARPYKERRIDDTLCDRDVAQGFKDRRLRIIEREDDNRPYKERRLDNALCDEDVAQGFKDRRPVIMTHEEKMNAYIERRSKYVDYMSTPISQIADALPEEKKEEPIVKAPPKPLVRDNCMMARMTHAFKCDEITDDIYRHNLMLIRDTMRDAEAECEEEEIWMQAKVYYGSNYPVMKRRIKIIC